MPEININVGIHVRPKMPVKPRRPKEVFKRHEVIWTSHDGDISLADVLHLIPSGIPAEKIFIRIDDVVSISYEHDVVNTKFIDQQKDYDLRVAQYEIEYARWMKEDAEWLEHSTYSESNVLSLFRDAINNEVNLNDEPKIKSE